MYYRSQDFNDWNTVNSSISPKETGVITVHPLKSRLLFFRVWASLILMTILSRLKRLPAAKRSADSALTGSRPVRTIQSDVETIEYILLIKRVRAARRDLITKSNIVVSICVLVMGLITGGISSRVNGRNVLKGLNHPDGSSRWTQTGQEPETKTDQDPTNFRWQQVGETFNVRIES